MGLSDWLRKQLGTHPSKSPPTTDAVAMDDISVLSSPVELLVRLHERKSTTVLGNEAIDHYNSLRLVHGDDRSTAEHLLEMVIRCQVILDKSWTHGRVYVLLTNVLSVASDACRDEETKRFLVRQAATVIALWKKYGEERGMRRSQKEIGEKFYADIVPEYLKTGQLPEFEVPVHPWQRGNEGLTIFSTKSFEEVRAAIRRAYNV